MHGKQVELFTQQYTHIADADESKLPANTTLNPYLSKWMFTQKCMKIADQQNNYVCVHHVHILAILKGTYIGGEP